MNKEFEIAIEELYVTFSKYPFKSKIEGCPCCVSDTDKFTLHSKPLRELQDEDISRYAFKAMTTWGDVNDFKHYVPRIFELLATKELIVDIFVVLGKLEYGNWLEWDDKEKVAITNFLKAWWKYEINYVEYFDSEIFIEINKVLKHLPDMLVDWNLDLETQGFKNYIDLLEDHYHDLKNKNKLLKALSEEDLKIFISWIEEHSYKLEEAFFRYENDDKEFSDRISYICLLYTSPSPRDATLSRMPSSA